MLVIKLRCKIRGNWEENTEKYGITCASVEKVLACFQWEGKIPLWTSWCVFDAFRDAYVVSHVINEYNN